MGEVYYYRYYCCCYLRQGQKLITLPVFYLVQHMERYSPSKNQNGGLVYITTKRNNHTIFAHPDATLKYVDDCGDVVTISSLTAINSYSG